MNSKNYEIEHRFSTRGVVLPITAVDVLRRAEMTLSRWAERECGDGSDWAIERDDATEIPYNTYHGDGKSRRYRIADREKGALRRVAALCKAHGLYYYHQGDPRGCALYVDNKPILDNNYTQAVACCYCGR